MLFNSFFRNVNVTLLCITNTPTMLYAVSPEKHGFHSGGSVGDSDPSFWIFWFRPWIVCRKCPYRWSVPSQTELYFLFCCYPLYYIDSDVSPLPYKFMLTYCRTRLLFEHVHVHQVSSIWKYTSWIVGFTLAPPTPAANFAINFMAMQ